MAWVYRAISVLDVIVIVGMIPIALLTKERKAVYRRKVEKLKEVVAREERQRTLTDWQLSWQNGPRGRWIARLIDNLDPWLDRRHGEIEYFLTQLLSGNGGFQSFVREMLKSAGSWSRVAHYVWALLIAMKIELNRWRDRLARVSLN